MVTATTTKRQRAFLWLVPSAITLGVVAFAASAPSDARVPAPLWWFAALFVVFAWFAYLSIPRRVVVNGAQLVLERPIHNISVPIADIYKIDARAWNRGFVIVRAKRRRAYLLREMPNLFAVVAEITSRNHTATVVGRVPGAA
jgi:hypothetical protein